MSDGLRRLPLISRSTPASEAQSLAVVKAPALALAIADTADGGLSLLMAEAFARACVLEGRTPFVVLSAFGAEPAPQLGFEDERVRVGRLGVRQSTDLVAFVKEHAEIPGPWICVGAPTLRGLTGALRLVLASPEARGQELDAVTRGEVVDAVLWAPRASLARPLIAAWLAIART